MRGFLCISVISCVFFNGFGGLAQDPCEGSNVCGKGATCAKEMNIIVCDCPEGMTGDPFTECTPNPDYSTTPTTTSTEVSRISSTTSPLFTNPAQMSNQAPSANPALISNSVSFSNPAPSSKPIIFAAKLELSSGPVPITPQEMSPQNTIQRQQDEEMLSHIATAPPTLSHYAHAHAQANQQRNEVNVPFMHPGMAPTTHAHLQQDGAQLFSDGSAFRTRTRPQPTTAPEHSQGGNHNQNTHSHQSQSDHDHSQASLNYDPHSQFTQFDLRQQQQKHSDSSYHVDEAEHSANGIRNYFKDPLGKYEDCRTVNNVIVCADTTGTAGKEVDNYQNEPDRSAYVPRPFIPPRQNMRVPTMRPAHGYEDSSLEIGSIFSSRLEGPYGHPANLPAASVMQDDFKMPMPMLPLSVESSASSKKRMPHSPIPGSPEFSLCSKFCGIDSVCRVFLGRPICGCPEGHTGDPSVKCTAIVNSKHDKNTCEKMTDCPASAVCINSQCTNPCAAEGGDANYCGPNAKCSVIHHTPLCACNDGFYGNPYVGCVV